MTDNPLMLGGNTGAGDCAVPRRAACERTVDHVARFERLTWADLNRLTRGELLDRVEAENAYWNRKAARGMSAEDVAAHREFGAIMHAALGSPAAAIDDTRQ